MKTPAEHAREICNLLNQEQRRTALAGVPGHMRQTTEEIVKFWFKQTGSEAKRIADQLEEREFKKLPAAIRQLTKRRVCELTQQGEA